MITSDEIALLRGLTKNEPQVFKLEASDKILLYAKWFVLELPANKLDPEFDAWAEVNEEAAAWRSKMPEGEGDYAQASRWTNPEDGVILLKLIADSGVALVHPSIYDTVMKHIPEPEFRVFAGDKPYVAIMSAGVLVGGTAQVKT